MRLPAPALLAATLALALALPVPAAAQPPGTVTCDAPGFADTRYAGRIATPEVFIDAVLGAGADVGAANTLVVVDIDNTLLDMYTDLGADQWYRWQKALTTTCGDQPMEVATAVSDATGAPGTCGGKRFAAMLDVQYLLFAALPMRALDGMAETVRQFQDLGFPVIALTARNPVAMDATRRELTRNGIDMAATAPAGALTLPSDDPTRPVRYENGIGMVSGDNKGERLLQLLDALGIDAQVERVVFLDDREKNVCEMQQAFDAAGRAGEIAVLRYDALRGHALSFLTDSGRQQAADAHWRQIRANLEEPCASIPGLCVASADPDRNGTDPAPGGAGSAGPPDAGPRPANAPLRLTTWNLEHMMSEAVYDEWKAFCEPHGWDDDAAVAAGKPQHLTYCNAHAGAFHLTPARIESLPLRTPEAFQLKVDALAARARELDADIYAFQEVSDADAVRRILPADTYDVFAADVVHPQNVAFAVRKTLGVTAADLRTIEDLVVCDPHDPRHCTRPGLELTVTHNARPLKLLNVHLKSGCRRNPVSLPEGMSEADYCDAGQPDLPPGGGCALLREQVPALEAWIDAQAAADLDFMVLGDFNRDLFADLGREARLCLDRDASRAAAREPITDDTRIESLFREISDGAPPDAALWIAGIDIDTRRRNCGGGISVFGCHDEIDHFVMGNRLARAGVDDRREHQATGRDYGDDFYCPGNPKPSDHCPVTLVLPAVAADTPAGGGTQPPTQPEPEPEPEPEPDPGTSGTPGTGDAGGTAPQPDLTDTGTDRPAPGFCTADPSPGPMPPPDLDGRDLRDWLRANWYTTRHVSLGYRGARRAMYSWIDVGPDGRVTGVYSGFSRPAMSPSATPGSMLPINAEHTVPQFFFNANPGTARGVMRADIHHLFPTHEDPNQSRGHDPFGEIEDDRTDTWFGVNADGSLYDEPTPPTGNLDLYAEDTDDAFEPPEGHEGNTARAVFYFYTMYPDAATPIGRIAADGLEQLYRWHLQDPPDAAEIARNARVATCQGNRNPYVDHPGLLCRAWGFDCD
jgi:hypothetical protein